MDALSFEDRRASVVRLLSYGGLVPFVGGTALAWMAEGDGQGAVVRAVVVYAVSILSFIGAIHWGRVLSRRDGETSGPAWLAWGVAPSLLGWGATLLPSGLTVPALILSFLLAWAVDRSAAADGRYPRWFGTLRTRLTIVVCLTLAALIPLAA
ncbi:DUF3429 domain-containing protein (plasmid) [Azospirillum baldaniorum]|uniref:DUF3429 domain-containing protein n=1 Tax=Azospirillum baldaniorum TaxID=1064539 RepID=A0A9P1JU78_9PROT|nr:DUF3429 domain-containing protein [Azospirillum baldaniorum]AWJ91572.1 DUF3429 domain-containing protein [Azospirillum baldaniorum]TWA83564.1 uncharacterized protein DUF3429 [Azospirillum brasilense]CCC99891.1 conserved membrane protein of unknown function [Azospirillum baldaniorum]